MHKVNTPLVETTKDFILIKIPRNLVGWTSLNRKITLLERGLQESMAEALSGKLAGPFRSGKPFLRALKNPRER